MLNLVQLLLLLFTITIRPISAAQHSLAVSLLTKGYFQHQIQTRTGLGKDTMGRINNEAEKNRENHSGGCSSKLSIHDNCTILCQITNGKLDIKPQNPSIPLYLIIFHLKLSEKH